MSSPNSVGVKSERVETLNVGEDTVDIRASIWVSSGDENSRPRNIEWDSVSIKAEEGTSTLT